MSSAYTLHTCLVSNKRYDHSCDLPLGIITRKTPFSGSEVTKRLALLSPSLDFPLLRVDLLRLFHVTLEVAGGKGFEVEVQLLFDARELLWLVEESFLGDAEGLGLLASDFRHHLGKLLGRGNLRGGLNILA